ncbi:MAG: hypothetical protein IPO76_10250 [Elusimicrobia bacterium]|nr:hypothetical protein [Elusimicrobiota bacterium]
MNTHAGRKLSRPTGARMALLRSLTVSLFRHEEIRTTVPKAKELDEDVRKKIYDVLVPRYQARPGGCTRIHRLGARSGDNAPVALIRLVS